MSNKKSFYPLLFVVFGFMLIIATGVDLLIGSENIPMIASIFGLIMIIGGSLLRKR